MSNFFVLGIIPGTQIQINFVGWLVISLALFSMIGALRYNRKHRTVRFALIHLSLFVSLRLRQLA